MKCHKFISLFGGVAAAWLLAAHAQESATMGTTKAPTATTPQIEVARVKPVDRMPPDLRLSENLIDLMNDFSLSSAQGIGGAWEIPPRAPTPFDARYGQCEITLSPAAVETPRPPLRDGNSPPVPSMGTGVEVETFQLMMNAKDLPSVELVDYTFVF